MLVKNVSARGWNVGGKMIAPGEALEVDVNEADIKGNADLEIVKSTEKKLTKKELEKAVAEAQEAVNKAIEAGDDEALKVAELALAELVK